MSLHSDSDPYSEPTSFALAPECYEISKEAANTDFIVWFDLGLNPWSNTVDAITLTIALSLEKK